MIIAVVLVPSFVWEIQKTSLLRAEMVSNDVSFLANRLFELCKMDGAVVVDKDLTRICVLTSTLICA